MAGLPPIPTSSTWGDAATGQTTFQPPQQQAQAAPAPAPAAGETAAVEQLAAGVENLNVADNAAPTQPAAGTAAPAQQQPAATGGTAAPAPAAGGFRPEGAAAGGAPAAADTENVLNDLADFGLNYGFADHEGEVEVAMADPNSVIYSAKTFEELNIPQELLQGLYAMKFKKPSKIQEKALPIILGSADRQPQNLIAQSQSGTGKTAAFTLGMLAAVDPTVPGCQAICVCPTRELARQNLEVAKEMGKFTQIVMEVCIPAENEGGRRGGRGGRGRGGGGRSGGRSEGKITKQMLAAAQIIVGTPGKIIQNIEKGVIATQNVRVFVLDEADQMLDMQGLRDVSIKIKNTLPRNHQVLFFSATFTDAVIAYGKDQCTEEPNIIRLALSEVTLDSIRQLWINCGTEAGKYEALTDIYGSLQVGQMIIFAQRKRTCDELYERLTREGHTCAVLHGDFSGGDRDRIVDDFKEGKTKVLIATNVMARGIDILAVNLVINYDMPVDRDGRPDMESYLHRIGRTGRFGRKGSAINFVHDQSSFNVMKAIEAHYGHEIKEVPFDEIENLQKKLKSAKAPAADSGGAGAGPAAPAGGAAAAAPAQ